MLQGLLTALPITSSLEMSYMLHKAIHKSRYVYILGLSIVRFTTIILDD